MTPARVYRRRLVAALLATLLPARALAQDATAGKALYKIYCQACHTVDPSTSVEPFNGIMDAANNPAAIVAAANADPSQMGWITTELDSVDLADIAAYLATFATASGTVAVVEFYHVARDHYFMSASAAEMADLDGGVHAGWVRTGLSFKAFGNAIAGASPACRFYLPPAYGDSHFYSASAAECAQIAAMYAGFVYETPATFYIGLPDAVSGACPAGWSPVYRLWNNRPDTNHRYTTSATVRQQMLAQGWVGEGYGPPAGHHVRAAVASAPSTTSCRTALPGQPSHQARTLSGTGTAWMRVGSVGWRFAKTRTSRPSTSTSLPRRMTCDITKLLPRHSSIAVSTR